MIARAQNALTSVRSRFPRWKLAWPAVAAALVILCFAWGLQAIIEDERRNAVADVLNSRLELTVDTLTNWTENRMRNIRGLAEDSGVQEPFVALNNRRSDAEALATHPAQQVVRRLLTHDILEAGYIGYFLISRDRINLASMRDGNIGKVNVLADQDWFFKRLDSGLPTMSNIVASDVRLPDGKGKLVRGGPTMFVGMPIKDSVNAIVGYLTARVPVVNEFSDILRAGRVGLTGETYAFDRKGLMLSESLFEGQLREIGLLREDQGTAMNLVLHDPGIDLTTSGLLPQPKQSLPLTRMAQSAVQGRSGADFKGYRDYRGVPVIGVWRWLDDLGLGIATEIDVAEAFSELRQLEYVIWAAAGLGIVVVSLYSLFANRNRRRLEEREEYLREIMATSGDGIIVIDTASVIETINDAASGIFGYAAEDLVGEKLDILLPESERRLHGRMVASSSIGSAQRVAGNRILFGRHKSGRQVPIELNISPMIVGDKRKYVGVLRDISERIEADAQIFQFKATVDNALDCVFMFDPTTLKFIYANAGAARQIGYSPEEMLCLTPVDIKPEFSESAFRAMIAPFIAGDTRVQTFQTVHRHRDGTDVPVEISLQYIDQDPAHPRFVAFVRDISERLAAEQAIRHREQTIRSVLDTSAAGIVLLDEEGRIHEANAAWDAYAHELGEKGKNIWVGQRYLSILETGLRVHSKQCAAVAEGVGDILQGRRMSWEHVYASGDGDAPRWFQVSCRAVSDVPGTRCVVTHFDITEMVKAQEKLQLAHEDASRANEAKSRFLATMSHEIRTPMNGVVGMIDLLRESELNAEQQSMVLTIRNSAFSLLGIINDILDLSKIEAGQLEIESIPVSLSEMIESVGDMVWIQAARSGVDLLIDPVVGGPGRIHSDPTRLRQVLVNLVGNAVKFSSGLGRKGKVRISTSFETDADGASFVHVRVSDNGAGMTRNQLGKLFRPFSQADSSTTRKFGGTGLGLTISHRIVGAMGGRIDVESTFGLGSCFTVVVPLNAASDLSEEQDLCGLRIGVLIEEDGDLGGIVERTLIAAGAHSETVHRSAAIDDYDLLVLGPSSEANTEGFRNVKLSDNPSAPKGMVLPDTVVVGCHPLKPTQLRFACAVAVGRASPFETLAPVDSLAEDEEMRTLPSSIETARAEGRLVLVAEDHAINRDVIRRQLNRLGYACEIAIDGREALDMWKNSGGYGLLLTDCHMPEMDGYELTRAIRDAEKAVDGEEYLPIVAITANALVGEADRCLSVGMNDYLAKPVEILRLKHVLKKWMPRREGKTGERAEAGPVGNSDSVSAKALGVVFDLSRLAELLGIEETGIDPSLLESYREAARMDLAAIEKAFEQRNAMALRDASHAAKGAAHSAGAIRLGDELLRLQTSTVGGEWMEIGAIVESVRQEFAAVEHWFEDRVFDSAG